MTNHEPQSTKTRVEFRPEGAAEAAISMELTGAAAEIHQSPERLRALMEMLELPEGTVATVIVQVSSSVVR